MVIIPFAGKNYAQEVAWDGEEHGRHQGRQQAGVVWAVEWAAVLLGLLPLGWREARWSLPRKIVALTASMAAWYTVLSLSFICTFPLLLALTGGYVLSAALKRTNDELQQLKSQPPVAPMQQAFRAAAPQSILLDADVATEPEKTDPDVEAQVARLLKVCERPLVIRPCGLYTVSRSNLLAILLTVSTYAVVLLQFNAEDLASGTLPLPGNCSCPCPDAAARLAEREEMRDALLLCFEKHREACHVSSAL
ncbi:hypothetical protein O3P69_020798 [Scylla paramamosain]|uniref:Uncharacterized protein n=1 Tax=Scylla paramamosain TaxID=85552 RepID=A0AAW0TNZ4_SCYPA